MLNRGRLLVQCVKNHDRMRDENVVLENENRGSPTPGPSTALDINYNDSNETISFTEPSLKMPTDLETTISMVDDSVADPDFQITGSERQNNSENTSMSVDSVQYEYDFNTLLFVNTDRTSTPTEMAPSTLNKTADDVTPDLVQNIDDEIIVLAEEDPIYSKTEKKAIADKILKEKNLLKRKDKHPIDLAPCSNCSNKCSRFDEEKRLGIWNSYWELDYTERRKWLASCMINKNVKRRRVQIENEDKTFRKQSSRKYFFKINGKQQRVCLSFLLKTLGYSSDSVIQELMKASKKAPLLKCVKENRGRKRGKISNTKLIEKHINSFNPAVAHYRRHNAPKMRYLPAGLSLNYLYDDFNLKHPKSCSKETYRKTFKDLGISVHTPECDVCGDCAAYKIIKKDCEEKGEDINEATKEKFEKHIYKASEAIQEYKDDSKVQESHELKIFSMDLQKVILLPHMPKVKEAFFVSRLIAFNETFASLKRNSDGNYCMVWHEGLAGRDAPQIVDSIITFMKEERDTENLIIWMDNCCAQNKNWFLYTAMVNTVNSDIVSDNLKTVTFKYLTKGHTHMSADGIHGNIETQMRKNQEIYDFRDWVETIKKSRQNMKVVPVTEFHDWQKKKRQPRKDNDNLKDVVLRNIVEIKFLRGTRNLKYKESFSDAEYINVNFLQPRFDISKKPNKKTAARGINPAKKQVILEKLVNLMPSNRQLFWKNIHETDTAIDLVSDGQVQEDF